jgi:transcriptional regulator with XRE-family HTH domain
VTTLKEFGDSLRIAREKAGISREDLFAQTRINLRHIKAIETGDFPSVPQTYIRAFIREFARIVGLDEDEALRTYNILAEQEAGVPIPPDAADNSNILPQMDDTIEILPTSHSVPKHVEVQGSAEVEEQAFVQQVRRSSAITDDLTETVDISVSPKQEAPAPVVDRNQLPIEFDGGNISVFRAGPDSASDDAQGAPEQAGEPQHKSHKTSDEKRGEPPRPSPAPPVQRPQAYAPPPRPLPPTEETQGPRRIVVIAGLITAIIVLGIAGAFLFRGSRNADTGLLDSAALRSGIDAGRYQDSLQSSTGGMMPGDTLYSDEPADEKAMEPKASAWANDDSLVLEAFSTAPVWFYVKMDTTRSERGTMASNDHFVWKARDQFTITLGDAGAVTFYLNGRSIGTLGNENTVVKNVAITRRLLKNN